MINMENKYLNRLLHSNYHVLNCLSIIVSIPLGLHPIAFTSLRLNISLNSNNLENILPNSYQNLATPMYFNIIIRQHSKHYSDNEPFFAKISNKIENYLTEIINHFLKFVIVILKYLT